MAELYEILRPMLEDYMLQLPKNEHNREDTMSETENNEESKLPLQLAIVGRPNVGKSTLHLITRRKGSGWARGWLNKGFNSIRAQFQFENRTIYLVDTAGWLRRSGQEKGPASLSVVQSRKNLMRAHVIALVLDGEEVVVGDYNELFLRQGIHSN